MVDYFKKICYFLNIQKKKVERKSGVMLKEEICRLREKLNNSIINGDDYSITYKISVQLDELIAEYYKMELDLSSNKIKKRIEEKNKVKERK